MPKYTWWTNEAKKRSKKKVSKKRHKELWGY